MLSTDQPDIIIITETWLTSNTTDSCITDSLQYSVFRCDRDLSDDHDRGGGVCILTKNNSVKAISVPLPPLSSHIEISVIDLLLPENATRFARLFAVYRPPGPNRQPDVLKYCTDMCNCIELLFPSNCTSIICGDFNVPDINWNHDNCN